MALPLIPIAIGLGASALFGLYKSGKAIVTHNDATDINNKTQALIDEYTFELDSARAVCQTALDELGTAKYEVLTKNIARFIEAFSQLKNVKFAQETSLNSLMLSEFSYETLNQIKEEISMLSSTGIGFAGGAAAGAMTAFGAYSGTALLATAGTGTAISSLSGAAATNATLAWLGGGTLASGGFGVAGGMVMLNAITAVPALAVMGWYLGNKAEEKLEEAKANKALAKKFVSDAKTGITLTDNITVIALKLSEIIHQLRKYSRRQTSLLNEIIQTQGTDFQNYDNGTKENVFKCFKSVQLLKAVIDTPILDQDGNLLGDISNRVDLLEQDLKLLN